MPPGAQSPPAAGSSTTGGTVVPPVVLAASNIPSAGQGLVRTLPADSGAASPAGTISTGGAGRTGRAPQRTPAVPAPPPPAAAVRPVAVVADSEIDRLLTEAWGLIERGDYEPARTRLEKARKRSHDDMRRLQPGAARRAGRAGLARGRETLRGLSPPRPEMRRRAQQSGNRRNAQPPSDRRDEALEGDPRSRRGHGRRSAEPRPRPPPDQRGANAQNAAVIKAADELYAQAAIAAAATWQSQVGFRVMPLPVPNGPYIGFTKHAWRMNDSSWSGPQAVSGKSKPASAATSNPAATYPAVTYPEVTYPTPMPPGALLSGVRTPGRRSADAAGPASATHERLSRPGHVSRHGWYPCGKHIPARRSGRRSPGAAARVSPDFSIVGD